MNWWIVRGISGRPPILNHLLIGFPEQCDCLSNFTTIASKTIKCQTSATRRYTQYYYFFLYAPYKSDTGVFSNIWISFLCALISVPFNEEGGERAAHQLINSGLPLTAAVTFNDVMAAGIMRILHQRGVQLPQQLSIVGFDDVVLARYLYPALTTMHYPVEQMARCAAQLAIQLYQGITPPPSSNHFNAELVIRDSVAPYFSR